MSDPWAEAFFSLPVGASPDDQIVGRDELGNKTYRTNSGAVYSLSVQESQPRKSVIKALAKSARNTPITESISNVAKALAGGAWDTISMPGRAAAGQSPSYGDVANFVGDYGAMSAFGSAPAGALRSGTMRQADTGISPAQEIADMLKSGRAADVTDDMIAAADPQELNRLYTRGATGQPMSLDQASRMARARDMGFDYARRSQTVDTPFNDVPWAMFAKHKGRIDETLEQLQTYGPGEWLGRADSKGYDAARSLVRAGRESKAYHGLSGAEIARMGLPDRIVDGAGLWDDPDVAKLVVDEIVASGGRSVQTPDGMVAFGIDGGPYALGGAIRAKSARFDPRLSHLANLSAGVAGGAYILTPEEQNPDEIRAYLDGLK